MANAFETEFKEKIRQWRDEILQLPAIARGSAARAIMMPHILQKKHVTIQQPSSFYDDALRFFVHQENLAKEKKRKAFMPYDVLYTLEHAFADFFQEQDEAASIFTAQRVAVMQRHTEPYKVTPHGLIVLPGVYYDWDSAWRADTIDGLMDARGKRVLDYMTGTGIAACVAAKQGAAEITLADSSSRALENALINLEKIQYTGTIHVHKLDAKSTFITSMQQDIMIANLPLCKDEKKYAPLKRNDLEMACYNNIDSTASMFQIARGKTLHDYSTLFVIAASYSDLDYLDEEMRESNFTKVRMTQTSRDNAEHYILGLRRKIDGETPI